MRVALYARVSTDRQEREGTIGSQLEALRTKAAAEGWAVESTCTDDGYSGSRLDRPGLDRVRDAAAARLIDAVVVLCPDRLARNYVHQAIVLEELSRFGVSVIFVEGGISDDPQGRLLAQIQAAVAEFERTKIVERNRRGKLWRARQGAVVSGIVPYGYRKVVASDGLPARLVICDDEANVIRQVFDWHANGGVTVRQIAIRLVEAGIATPKGNRVWQTSTLDRMLRQEAYAGTFYYNRFIEIPETARLPRHSPGHRPIRQQRPREEWIPVTVPAIVDIDTWTRSQAAHRGNARFSPRHVGAERYLLRYLVRCAECGQARASGGKVQANGAEQRYYRCHAVLPMHLREEKLRCSQPAARADDLDQLVWGEVVRHLRHPDLIARACIQSSDDDTPKPDTDRQLGELRAQDRRLVDAYQAGAISLSDLNARRRPLTDRVAELERGDNDRHQRHMTRAQLRSRIDEFANQIEQRLETMPFAERQALVRSVLEKVVVSEHQVELCFKIPLPAGPKEGKSRRPPMSGRLRSQCQTTGGLRPLRRPGDQPGHPGRARQRRLDRRRGAGGVDRRLRDRQDASADRPRRRRLRSGTPGALCHLRPAGQRARRGRRRTSVVQGGGPLRPSRPAPG